MSDLTIIEDTDMGGEPPLPYQLLEPLATRVATQQDLLAIKDAAATFALPLQPTLLQWTSGVKDHFLATTQQRIPNNTLLLVGGAWQGLTITATEAMLREVLAGCLKEVSWIIYDSEGNKDIASDTVLLRTTNDQLALDLAEGRKHLYCNVLQHPQTSATHVQGVPGRLLITPFPGDTMSTGEERAGCTLRITSPYLSKCDNAYTRIMVHHWGAALLQGGKMALAQALQCDPTTIRKDLTRRPGDSHSIADPNSDRATLLLDSPKCARMLSQGHLGNTPQQYSFVVNGEPVTLTATIVGEYTTPWDTDLQVTLHLHLLPPSGPRHNPRPTSYHALPPLYSTPSHVSCHPQHTTITTYQARSQPLPTVIHA
jgi:hypothetical protein